MWYNKIINDDTEICNFISYYENELISARKETAIRGSLERQLADLPGIIEHRFSQLQEIEAVLNFLNIKLNSIRRKVYQKYMEHYAKALSSREADKYTDGEPEVVDMELIINSVAFVRNSYLSIIKALESKNFMMSNIVKLRTAGLETIEI